MKLYTVKQVAKLAGISVRALHHYDEIGLLRPALIGDNRYRYYGRNELLRLQQILIHRELDIPLQAIGALLDSPGFDRLASLHAQRERLQAKAERYRQLVTTIDRTIADLNGVQAMKDTELYTGVVAPEKQAEYERWLVEHYGDDSRRTVQAAHRRLSERSDLDRQGLMAELATIEQSLADALRRGIAADSPTLDPLLSRHCAWVGQSWGQPPSAQAYAGLADLYLAHPDFVARYEAIRAGFAQYLATAMKAWAQRAKPA